MQVWLGGVPDAHADCVAGAGKHPLLPIVRGTWPLTRRLFLCLSLSHPQPPVVFCHPVANCFHRCRPDPPAETPGGSRVDAADPEPEAATTGADSAANDSSKIGEGARKSEEADKQSKTKSSESESKASNGTHGEKSTSETSGEEKKSGHPSKSNSVAAPTLTLADPATVESAKSSSGEETAPGEHAYVSTFIMGLSFQKGSRFIDIEPPIKVSKPSLPSTLTSSQVVFIFFPFIHRTAGI